MLMGSTITQYDVLWTVVFSGDGDQNPAQFRCPFWKLGTGFDEEFNWETCENVGIRGKLRKHIEDHQIAGHLPQTPAYAVKLPAATGILCDGHRSDPKPLRWKRIHTGDCIARDSGLVTESASRVRARFVILMKYH